MRACVVLVCAECACVGGAGYSTYGLEPSASLWFFGGLGLWNTQVARYRTSSLARRWPLRALRVPPPPARARPRRARAAAPARGAGRCRWAGLARALACGLCGEA